MKTIVILVLGWAGVLSAMGQQATYSNPVLAGDYPDPSVIRVGKDYWATATSSEWGPHFPLLHSRDLVNWEIVGPVFEERPDWAVANFWAPEISAWKDRYFIYYTARQKNGPLAVAVATADRPQGPYTDHGPLVAQEAGSIDAMPVTDENGQRWLTWKEDGNSRRLPTPLWAQRLDETGTKLIGERHELIRNDAPWEGGLVEGQFILRHGPYFYMFYSGNGCCGRNCTYALGVARSKALLGPWEKNPANPILAGTENTKCPGHGSIVMDPMGRYWLLYHAYDAETFVYTGREMYLDQVVFKPDGWPSINQGRGPTVTAYSPFGVQAKRNEIPFEDEFRGRQLRPGWQWPQNNRPRSELKLGRLHLQATGEHAEDPLGAIVARAATSGDYVATTRVWAEDLPEGALVGLAAIGDASNALGVGVKDGQAILWRVQRKEFKALARLPGFTKGWVHLRMKAQRGDQFAFEISQDGRQWQSVGDTSQGDYLPPWDRSVRVGLIAGGAEVVGQFDFLRIK